MQIKVRSVGLLPGFLLVFFFLLSVTAAEQNSTQYVDPTQNPNSTYSKVTCDFSHDSCGWKNVGGHMYPLTWRKVGDYMHLNMKSAGNDRKGRLASPWLEPLGYHSCQLRFRYYIRSSSYLDCQLSLLRQTGSDVEEVIWETKQPTGLFYFSSPITKDINCTGEEFRMVFEGKGSCRVRWYNEIDVKAINLTVWLQNQPPATPVTPAESGDEAGGFTIEHTYTGTLDDLLWDDAVTTTTATTDSTTTTSFSSGASTDRSVKDKDDDDNKGSGLDAGATAGIIIAIIIVVVVFVALFIVVIVFFRRRRQRDTAMKNSIKRNMSRAVTNSMYMHNEVETIGNNGAAATDPRPPPRLPSEAEHHYELADLHPPLPSPPALPSNDNDNHHYDNPTDGDPFPPATTHPPPNGPRQPPQDTTVLNTENHYHGYDPHPTLDAAATVQKHDYTNTEAAAVAAGSAYVNMYDHTNGPSRSAAVTEEDNYNHLDPRRHNTLSDTRPYQNAGNEYMDMEGAPGHSTSQHYTEPDPAILAPNHPRNTENPTKSPQKGAFLAHTDYELVDDVVEEMRSASRGDDAAYHSLDVTGERNGERVVGENVYDHAKGDDYDTLHQDSRKMRQQQAQNDYSHVEGV